ncbi:MAG TPA: hypothetical protein VGJ87_14120 [Roseiflexaceae bacterium]
MQTQPTPRSQISGPAIAAMYAALLGLLTMAIVNVIMEASAPFKDAVFGIGKAWMPGAAGIGPYSGKETILLVVWLGAWVILHYALRKRDLPLKPWAIGFLIGIGVATTLFWPPIIEFLVGG